MRAILLPAKGTTSFQTTVPFPPPPVQLLPKVIKRRRGYAGLAEDVSAVVTTPRVFRLVGETFAPTADTQTAIYMEAR